MLALAQFLSNGSAFLKPQKGGSAMKKRQLRRWAAGIALAALLLGILGPAAMLASAARSRSEAATAMNTLRDDPEAPSSGAWEPPEDGLVVAVTGPAGTVCTLTNQQGRALTVLTVDADGWCATPKLSPGVYGLVFSDGTKTAFSLRENASLAVLEGDSLLWTDGELLHLAGEAAGTVTVAKRLQAQDGQFAGLDAAFLFQLEAEDGTVRQRTVGFYEGLEAQDGWYTLTIQFTGLPAGTYTLTETAFQAGTAAVTIDGQTAALPAQVTVGEGQWTVAVVSESGDGQ